MRCAFLLFNASYATEEGVGLNKRTKKIILLSITICVAVAIIAFAASRSSKQVENSFAPASASIGIVENGTAVSGDTNSVAFATDGDDFVAKKEVQIQNPSGANSIPVFVRVCIFPKFYVEQTDNTQTQLAVFEDALPASVSENSFTMGDVTFNLVEDWKDNWYYSGGYFYYIGENSDGVAGVLDVGEVTPPLLKSVSVNVKKYNSDYVDRGAKLRVVVIADSIQTVGGAVDRWNTNSKLISNDVKRPTESDNVVSSAAAEAEASSAASRAAVTSGDNVVTQYQRARINDMIASVTVSSVYETDDNSENNEKNESTGNIEGYNEEEKVPEVDSVDDAEEAEETEEIEEIEED
jgi:hypothetical protein